jgi:hypothetical protein
MTVWYAGTQYTFNIPLDTLIGSDFHATYMEYLTRLREVNDDGLPKNSFSEMSEALQGLVWRSCRSILEARASAEVLQRHSLQTLIQPPCVHITIAKAGSGDSHIIAEVVQNKLDSHQWHTSNLARSSNDSTNVYGWGTAPVPIRDLPINTIAQLQHFKASELSVSTAAGINTFMQKVRISAGESFFFKPRLDLMAPEFDREVSILNAIIDLGLNKTLHLSPLKGLVLLDNDLVAGMLFDWLEGSPLAGHSELGNQMLHKKWREQVQATVDELHRHQIIWGDVNVHNIFIDANDDAWVIDFGGNCNVQFVDEELKETFEGDRQGLRRIFEDWLPSRAHTSN